MRQLVALLLLSTVAFAVPRAADLSVEITAKELENHAKVLASDEYQGRRPGTPGGELAKRYVAARFAEIGLEPAGDEGTFLQSFDLPVRRLEAEVSGLSMTARGKDTAFRPGVDWRAFPSSPSTTISGAEVVFAGYGLSVPSAGYDDYAGPDVKGKVVLILRHGPREGAEEALFAGRNRGYVTFAAKARFAAKAGAAAVILVNDSRHMKGDPLDVPLLSFRMPNRLPFLFAKERVARGLLAAAGADLDEVQQRIDEAGRPFSFPLAGVRVSLELTMRPIRSANVVGLLEGSSPKLGKEVIVVGAHYDHLGTDGMGGLDRGGEGAVWHGADDNASGTIGVIELAEQFALSKRRPRRSFLFVAFTGEEMGLLGSRHYVERPVLPLEDTVAMLNLDMVGRMRESRLHIGGVGTSPVFDGFITEASKGSGLDIVRGRGGAAPSDNSSFFRKHVPALFFFTGLHPDYHRTTDTWDKLNCEGERRVLSIVSRILRSLDALPERPVFVNAQTAFLGVQFDRRDKEAGVRLARVVPNGPAARAGLESGDRVVSFDGKPVETAADLSAAIRARIGGEEVLVTVRRGEKELSIRVVLGAR